MTHALRERIDMAVFGPVPGFVRASVRLDGIDPSRGGAQAAALLRQASRAAAAAGPPDDAPWRLAYEAVGLPPDTVPPPVALAAWAAREGGVPSQGTVHDLVNATALRHGVPAAAYDLGRAEGDLWLRPSRGVEWFAPAVGEPAVAPINELILADSADQVLARAWHGAQGAAGRIDDGARDVLVHFDLLPADLDGEPPLAQAEAIAAAFARLAAGFVGGTARWQVLRWSSPQAAWPA